MRNLSRRDFGLEINEQVIALCFRTDYLNRDWAFILLPELRIVCRIKGDQGALFKIVQIRLSSALTVQPLNGVVYMQAMGNLCLALILTQFHIAPAYGLPMWICVLQDHKAQYRERAPASRLKEPSHINWISVAAAPVARQLRLPCLGLWQPSIRPTCPPSGFALCVCVCTTRA